MAEQMTEQFKQGDRVEWQAGAGTTTGTVQERITEHREINGHAIAASKDDPRYLVKNSSTGKVTGHKPSALSQADGSSNKTDSGENSRNQAERDEHIRDFTAAVNMTAKQIEAWLATDKSKSVGQRDDDGKIKGRKSGQHIVEILKKNKADYTADDLKHMRKVVSYVHRHTAQRPSGDVTETNWRYSLMNWGHDPTK